MGDQVVSVRNLKGQVFEIKKDIAKIIGDMEVSNSAVVRGVLGVVGAMDKETRLDFLHKVVNYLHDKKEVKEAKDKGIRKSLQNNIYQAIYDEEDFMDVDSGAMTKMEGDLKVLQPKDPREISLSPQKDEPTVAEQNMLDKARGLLNDFPYIKANVVLKDGSPEIFVTEWAENTMVWREERWRQIISGKKDAVTKSEKELKDYWSRRKFFLEKHNGKWAVSAGVFDGVRKFYFCVHQVNAIRKMEDGGLIIEVGNEFGEMSDLMCFDSMEMDDDRRDQTLQDKDQRCRNTRPDGNEDLHATKAPNSFLGKPMGSGIFANKRRYVMIRIRKHGVNGMGMKVSALVDTGSTANYFPNGFEYNTNVYFPDVTQTQSKSKDGSKKVGKLYDVLCGETPVVVNFCCANVSSDKKFESLEGVLIGNPLLLLCSYFEDYDEGKLCLQTKQQPSEEDCTPD